MIMLQRWKQVCRSWNHHIRVYTDPDNHRQRNLRTELREAWQSIYDRALPIAQKDDNKPHQEPCTVTIEDTAALCLTMDKFNFSRALVEGVASIISMLTHTNELLFETMGPNACMKTNPLTHGRIALQSHLADGLLRHGLLQTPWHTNQTGPWAIGQKILEEKHMDILPRLLQQGQQEPAQVRTEAQRRGYDIFQILQALLDIGNPTETDTALQPPSAHELWDLQRYNRRIIPSLYVLLPIITLTGLQEPLRKEMGRVGRTLLIQLLTLRNNPESTLPNSIHTQNFGHVWTVSVPGRTRNASTHVSDWADTIAIWINPRDTLASNLGHCGNDEEEEEPPGADPAHRTGSDADSQRAGLTLLRLLRSEPARETNAEVWKGFIFALSASRDLLTALNRTITHPLAEDVKTFSMQGVESVYREFLEVTHWDRDGPVAIFLSWHEPSTQCVSSDV